MDENKKRTVLENILKSEKITSSYNSYKTSNKLNKKLIVERIMTEIDSLWTRFNDIGKLNRFLESFIANHIKDFLIPRKNNDLESVAVGNSDSRVNEDPNERLQREIEERKKSKIVIPISSNESTETGGDSGGENNIEEFRNEENMTEKNETSNLETMMNRNNYQQMPPNMMYPQQQQQQQGQGHPMQMMQQGHPNQMMQQGHPMQQNMQGHPNQMMQPQHIQGHPSQMMQPMQMQQGPPMPMQMQPQPMQPQQMPMPMQPQQMQPQQMQQRNFTNNKRSEMPIPQQQPPMPVPMPTTLPPMPIPIPKQEQEQEQEQDRSVIHIDSRERNIQEFPKSNPFSIYMNDNTTCVVCVRDLVTTNIHNDPYLLVQISEYTKSVYENQVNREVHFKLVRVHKDDSCAYYKNTDMETMIRLRDINKVTFNVIRPNGKLLYSYVNDIREAAPISEEQRVEYLDNNKDLLDRNVEVLEIIPDHLESGDLVTVFEKDIESGLEAKVLSVDKVNNRAVFEYVDDSLTRSSNRRVLLNKFQVSITLEII